jgi:hypothetical protein
MCLWVTQCTCATTGDQIPLPSLILTSQKKGWPSRLLPRWRERWWWKFGGNAFICDVTYYYVALNQLYTHTEWKAHAGRSTAPFLFVTMRALFLSESRSRSTYTFSRPFPFQSRGYILYDKYKSCFLTRKESLRKGALMRQTCCGIWRKSLWLFSIP